MSYAEAKEIALMRIELRVCWSRGDIDGANAALEGLARHAAEDLDIAAETRRWAVKLAALEDLARA